MTAKPRTVLVGASQAPFTQGGAEEHVAGLVRELGRRGFRTDLFAVPFRNRPRVELVHNCLLWRLLDLEEAYGEAIDLFIGTKFPTYLARHPRKIVWLLHQLREVYDLYGTPHSAWGEGIEDEKVRDAILKMDRLALGEARKIFTNSRNVASRLKRFSGLEGEPLYHPPPLAGKLRPGPHGDAILSVARLDRTKRVDLLVRAMRHAPPGVRCLVVGTGPEEGEIRAQVAREGLEGRVRLLGFVDEATLLDLYADCLAVFYAPVDEDYGYVTLEAFLAKKPVLTATDSGGILEFVEDGRDGFVCEPAPEVFAARMDWLLHRKHACADMGEEGFRKVAGITWENVIERLTGA